MAHVSRYGRLRNDHSIGALVCPCGEEVEHVPEELWLNILICPVSQLQFSVCPARVVAPPWGRSDSPLALSTFSLPLLFFLSQQQQLSTWSRSLRMAQTPWSQGACWQHLLSTWPGFWGWRIGQWEVPQCPSWAIALTACATLAPG